MTKVEFCAFLSGMKRADDDATQRWWLDVWMRDIRIYRSNIYIWVACIVLSLLALAPRRHFPSPLLLPGLCVVMLSLWQLTHDWCRIHHLKAVCRDD